MERSGQPALHVSPGAQPHHHQVRVVGRQAWHLLPVLVPGRDGPAHDVLPVREHGAEGWFDVTVPQHLPTQPTADRAADDPGQGDPPEREVQPDQQIGTFGQ